MKYTSLLKAIISQHCIFHILAGSDWDNRIVGGKEVKPKGRYPYQVAMIDSSGDQYCGGSLIDKDWVLCAAHCYGYGSKVYIGRHDLSDGSENYESIKIEKEIRHPKYNGATLDNDFMMVKLKQSSSYTPVKLDDGSANVSAGVDVTVMGWGTTSSGGPSSDILLEVDVDIVINSDCNDAYNGDITKNMLCAARKGKDSCQGDSGGPLIVKGSDVSGDIQVGVVSWGNGCADRDYPGVYARVSSQIDWINKKMANPDDDDNSGGNGDNDSGEGSYSYDYSGGGSYSYDYSGGGSYSYDYSGGGSYGYDYSGGQSYSYDYSGGGTYSYSYSKRYSKQGNGDGNWWGGSSGDSWWMDSLKKLLH